MSSTAAPPVPKPLTALVEQRTGLAMDGPHARRADLAVRSAAAAHGCREALALAAVAGRDDGALEDLIAGLLVHESYFFRDPRQMAMVSELLGGATNERGHVVQVWSAGCARGEEAGTVAMLADEAGLGDRVRVLGTDLSPAGIDEARSARYGPRALRAATPAQVQRWFRPTGDAHTVVVTDPIRARLRFAVHNLLDPPPGRFDLVLCRNVLMYLTASGRARAAERLADALRPGGWLVTGASDPPLDTERLTPLRTRWGTAYVGTDRPAAPPEGLDGPQGLRCHGIPAHPADDAGDRPVRPALGRASPLASASASASDRTAERAAPRVRRLLDDGRGEDARSVVVEALSAEPLDPELRRLATMAFLDAGDPEQAERQARASVYLDPGSADGHRLLGWAQQRLGRHAEAHRSYRRAARLEAAPMGRTP